MESTSASSEASMMFGEAPTVLQSRSPSSAVDEDARRRFRAVVAVEDTHLVVLEVDALRAPGRRA